MNCVRKYLARYVPRYSASELDDKLYENLIAQRALWGAVAFIAINKCKASVEFRLEARPDASNIDLALLFYSHTSNGEEAIDEELNRIQRLLPAEYGWVLDDNEKKPLEIYSGAWNIVRLTRRIEYVDIPSISTLFTRNSNAVKSHEVIDKKTDSSLVSDTKSFTQRPSSVGQFADLLSIGSYQQDNIFKRLPPRLLKADDIHKRPYCLPVLGGIDDHRPRLSRLLAEMREAKPVIVSLVLHPVEENEMASSRSTALSWKRFLDFFASDVANVGFSDYHQLRAVYDRYSLPLTHLLHLSVRVASTTDAGATSVANVLAATLGGIQAFQVSQQTKGQVLDKLILRDIDMVTQPEQNTNTDKLRSRVKKELEQASIVSSIESNQLDFISRLPHIYTLEEIERIVRLPIADDEGLPGLDTRPVAPFAPPSYDLNPVVDNYQGFAVPDKGRIRIGMVKTTRPVILNQTNNTGYSDISPSRYADAGWHTLPIQDLTKHTLIVGSTGSGKTMTTLFLLRELARTGIPFLVIEPVKTEYYDRLARHGKVSCQRFRFEGDDQGKPSADFLAFDPMRLPKGVTVARHASYLKSCFEAAFPLEPVAALLLEAGIRSYYTEHLEQGGCGLSLFQRGEKILIRSIVRTQKNGKKHQLVSPSLHGFFGFFLDRFLSTAFPAEQNQPKLIEIKRRFEAIWSGMIGESAKLADAIFIQNKDQGRNNPDPFDSILHKNTIIELDGIPDEEQKSLLMAFLLTALFERRQAEDFLKRSQGGGGDERIKHVLVVEEAHRILTNTGRSRGGETVGLDAKAKAVSLFVDMLAEIRALGQGLVIVEQIPTKIVTEAIKNTNLKIMLRLTSRDDREYLGEAMNFTEPQKRFVTNLRVEPGEGIGMVVFEQGIDQPSLLSLPLPKERSENWLYDEFFEIGSE